MTLLRKNQKGFIALFSVVIISSILLLMAVTLSFSGFFGRFNILDSELKQKSNALASACIDSAILHLANDNDFTGNVTVPVGGNSCDFSVTNSSGQATIFASATFGVSKKAYTYYKTVIDTDTLATISFEECKMLSPCP